MCTKNTCFKIEIIISIRWEEFPYGLDFLAFFIWRTINGCRWRLWRVEGGRMGGGAWMWRRRHFAWEEECVRVCSVLLHDIVLQEHTVDRWTWLLDPAIGYTVKETYHYLTSADTHPDRGLFDNVWHKYVPLKVSLFAWRLLRNWLPTKDNLVWRCALQQDDNQCVGGCGLEEIAGHLFLGCDIFGSLWSCASRWLGITFVTSNGVRDHLLQFGHLAG